MGNPLAALNDYLVSFLSFINFYPCFRLYVNLAQISASRYKRIFYLPRKGIKLQTRTAESDTINIQVYIHLKAERLAVAEDS